MNKKNITRSIGVSILSALITTSVAFPTFADDDYGNIEIVNRDDQYEDNVDTNFRYYDSEKTFDIIGEINPQKENLSGTKLRFFAKKSIPQEYKSLYDPRMTNLVTSIKNQGDLGVCWAFAGLSTYESFVLKNGLKSQDFSEDHMRWWAKNGDYNWKVNDVEGTTNETPVGYLTSWSGPKFESDMPYNGSLFEDKGAKKPDNFDTAPLYDYRVTDVINLSDDIESVKNAVYAYGAVMTGYYESDEYTSADASSFYCDEPKGQNHSVSIVGWDDNYPIEKFTGKAKPEHKGAWLVKSSWGEFNSEGGYVWISYEDQTILSYKDNYAISGHIKYNDEKLYQHDYSYVTSIRANKLFGVNVFDFNEENERLQSVMFATESQGAKYKLYYVPVIGNQPDASLKKLIKTGTVPHSGYISVDTENFALPNGKGGIGLEIDNSSSKNNSTICVEMNLDSFDNFVAKANPGESYVYQNGKLVDLNTQQKYKPANLVIKAISNHKKYGFSIIGSNRFETAIKLSDHGFTNVENAIIVNSGAVVDALTSSPLARLLNAPILLTDSESLTEATSNQLTKLGVKNVTIIGGYGSVGKKVEEDLIAKKINISRISGSDRFETALKIADEVKSKKPAIKEIAVVNGIKGLADAISFSTVSASKTIPIILTEADGSINKGMDFAKDKSVEKTYIIGGANSVSTKTEGTLTNPQRLSGKERRDTNAKVIEEFYKNSSYDRVYIVKDGKYNASHLIDGLAVGPIGGKNNSPLIIGSWALSDAQKSVLKDKKFNDIIQVGGGVNSPVKTELIYLNN